MKAIILAGGNGTRLKDISQGLPKPMMPILGKPLLERIVVLLRENGFSDIRMALCFEPEVIQKYFGGGENFDVHISYSIEQTSLGTAGAVKNCSDFIGQEDFLVISGDAACDFDLATLMRSHAKSGALATIALYPQEEPLSYGLVLTESSGFVTGFLEKPAWDHVVTDMVSTGIYALSSAVLQEIPDDSPYDFAKDLFPRLLQEGRSLHAWKAEGYWCDIGTPVSYYRCNLDALEDLYRLPDQNDSRHIVRCRSRARLMRAMSENLAEFGLDFTDGLSLKTPDGSAHIAPLPGESAVVIEGGGSLCRRLEDLARKFESEI